MARVAEKVCIVTGAASGMGKADALLLAAEGAKVVLTDLNAEAGEALAADIGGDALFIRHDVSSEQDWQQVIAATVERFGRLDVLVNNAGMMRMTDITQCSLEEYQLINRVNNDSVFLGCKHAIPAMTESGGGSIINMSSVAALHGMPYIPAYCASKGAVAALTKSVAIWCREKNNGIRVNSIHPDGVKTPMVVKVATGKDTATDEEIQALGDAVAKMNSPMCEPEDVANLVLFLASEESRFITAAEMLIDNGATATPPNGR